LVELSTGLIIAPQHFSTRALERGKVVVFMSWLGFSTSALLPFGICLVPFFCWPRASGRASPSAPRSVRPPTRHRDATVKATSRHACWLDADLLDTTGIPQPVRGRIFPPGFDVTIGHHSWPSFVLDPCAFLFVLANCADVSIRDLRLRRPLH